VLTSTLGWSIPGPHATPSVSPHVRCQTHWPGVPLPGQGRPEQRPVHTEGAVAASGHGWMGGFRGQDVGIVTRRLPLHLPQPPRGPGGTAGQPALDKGGLSAWSYVFWEFLQGRQVQGCYLPGGSHPGGQGPSPRPWHAPGRCRPQQSIAGRAGLCSHAHLSLLHRRGMADGRPPRWMHPRHSGPGLMSASPKLKEGARHIATQGAGMGRGQAQAEVADGGWGWGR
jgi:hypothetical protein